MKTAAAVKLKSLTMGTVMGLLAPLVASGEAIGTTLTPGYAAETVGLEVLNGSDGPEISPLLTTAGDPSDYLVNPGEGYDGVTELILQSGGSANRCSGALLETGAHILTAAHCVTDDTGALNVFDGTVNFHLDTGNVGLSFRDIFIHPDWTYDLLAGNDIAILGLDEIAPDAAERFDIYRQTDEKGQLGDKVGYGRSGTGDTGDNISSGTKRAGENRYDATGEKFNFWGASDNTLVYDFDNGLPENDAFGSYFGNDYAELGLGPDEVNAAPGDSGGPTFINGLLAGITSFSLRAGASDIDNTVNASYGEFSFDTRVSSYIDWIDNILNAWDGGGDVVGGDPGDVVGGDPGDAIGGDPGDEVGGDPGDQVGGDPGDVVGGDPGDQVGGDPGDVVGGDPGDVVGGDPGDQVGGDPGDVVGGDPGDQVGGDPGDVVGGDPGDQVGGDPGDVVGGDPGDVVGGDPGDVVGGDPGGEDPVSVPEPSALAGLMVLGAGLLLTRKKHRST